MGIIFKRSRADNPAVSGRIGPKFKLFRDFMVALFTCKNDEDPIKNIDTRVLTRLYYVEFLYP